MTYLFNNYRYSSLTLIIYLKYFLTAKEYLYNCNVLCVLRFLTVICSPTFVTLIFPVTSFLTFTCIKYSPFFLQTVVYQIQQNSMQCISRIPEKMCYTEDNVAMREPIPIFFFDITNEIWHSNIIMTLCPTNHTKMSITSSRICLYFCSLCFTFTLYVSHLPELKFDIKNQS